ncbi:GGDEF domain-containing protein [Rhodocyclus tenuis]|uniref:diguanylate cyclase n=1 Tax=Rhodocyclus tenuis TaxID=1066 RepID=A0A840G6L5_RHOTE|nr:diguanylate cyclase [Rhodocyclus tenuis]MBB4247051.1 diguanylate cyclase (GGDEF)-like protein [Rhodocyclus tenuis]
MNTKDAQTARQQRIRSLFDEYIEMYSSRDDRLTARFSSNFSGYTGGGDFLVKDCAEWQKITRQDFAQVPGRLRIEMLDLSLQDISDDVVVVAAFFHIHLPVPDQILSRETARLVLIFRIEDADWKIVHSGISIPYHLVESGEVYPLKGLHERNSQLETLVEARTRELEEANLKLELLSNTDGLTGIANRRSFDHVFLQEWQRAQRSGNPLALIMLDVDHFKLFNDRYGHLVGDDCLRSLAQVLLKEVRRSGELVARYGGEEFVVLLPDSDLHAAADTARRIQEAVRALAIPHADVPSWIVSFSLGVASLTPNREQVPDDLLSKADAALYHAKNLGRDRVELAPL